MPGKAAPCFLERPAPGIFFCWLSIPDMIALRLEGRVPADYAVRPPVGIASTGLALDWLNPNETRRVAGFKAQKRQVEWVAGRLALKSLAAAVLFPTTPLAEIAIDQSSLGAPFLPSAPEGTAISLSHSHDRVVAGLAIGHRRLGLDIEKIVPQRLPAIMKVAFSERERESAAGAPPAEVFRRWVLKEAFLKFLGKGFHEPLRHVEVLEEGILHKGRAFSGLQVTAREMEGYLFAALWGERLRDGEPLPDPLNRIA